MLSLRANSHSACLGWGGGDGGGLRIGTSGWQYPAGAWWCPGHPGRIWGAGDCLTEGTKLLGASQKESGEQRCQRPSKDLMLPGPIRTVPGEAGVCVCVCVCVCVHMCSHVCIRGEKGSSRDGEGGRETETDKRRERLRDVRSF